MHTNLESFLKSLHNTTDEQVNKWLSNICEDTTMNEVARLKARIEKLEGELHLEKTWAEGEIDFWKSECDKAEEELMYALMQLNKPKSKPWWRHIIS